MIKSMIKLINKQHQGQNDIIFPELNGQRSPSTLTLYTAAPPKASIIRKTNVTNTFLPALRPHLDPSLPFLLKWMHKQRLTPHSRRGKLNGYKTDRPRGPHPRQPHHHDPPVDYHRENHLDPAPHLLYHPLLSPRLCRAQNCLDQLFGAPSERKRVGRKVRRKRRRKRKRK